MSSPGGRARRRGRAHLARPGRLRRGFLVVLVGLVGVGALGTVGTAGVVSALAGTLPSIEQLSSTNLDQSTRIYDRNGTLIEELYLENRVVVPLDQVSPLLQRATIATEDRTFYSNSGVDYRRIAAAMLYDLLHRNSLQGASTITQQVVKLDVLGDSAQTLSRKVKELVLAEELERRYSKPQILALYLNSIPYGNHAYGAEAASETYFGKPAKDLSLAEASFLAGLPQSPNAYNPLGDSAEKQAALVRWKEVLDSMRAAGYISPAQEDAARRVDLLKEIAAQNTGSARDPRTAHFVDYVVSYLTQKYGERKLYTGGLTVVTSLDLPTQYAAYQALQKGVSTYSYKGANTGAVLAMDSANGEIVAMIGSADYNNPSILGQVNLTGVDPTGYRPVGSSFKVYTYGAALDSGQLNAASLVNDANPVIDGHRYSDWDSRTEGMIPLRRALTESRNLPALWTYQQIGSTSVINFARSLGITTPFADPASLPTTLGTDSLSMVQHLAAYSAFDNGGYKVIPHPVLKVTDAAGRVLESFNGGSSRERVMSADEAYLMTNLLQGPPQQYLPVGGHPVAAKSGTTEAWTGAYWIGFTPTLAVATYMAHINAGSSCDSGYASLAQDFTPSGWLCPTDVLWGEQVGQSVWWPFVSAYYSHRPWPTQWARPSGIVDLTVCKSDGLLAGPGLPPAATYQEIFIQSNGEPQGTCSAPSPSPSATPQATIGGVPSPPSTTPTPGPAPTG